MYYIAMVTIHCRDLGIFVDVMETEGFAAISQKLQVSCFYGNMLSVFVS